METKTIRTKKYKIFEIDEYQKHFGWEDVGMETTKDEDIVILHFKREVQQHISELKSLEKQIKKVDSAFPIAPIIWLLIGVGFLVAYFMLPTLQYREFFLIGVIVPFLVGLTLLINFILIKCYSKRIKEKAIQIADTLSGRVVEFPIVSNIKQQTKDSNHIRNNLRGKR